MNSGLCGLIMEPVLTSISGGSWPEARASFSVRAFCRSDSVSVVCDGGAGGCASDILLFGLLEVIGRMDR